MLAYSSFNGSCKLLFKLLIFKLLCYSGSISASDMDSLLQTYNSDCTDEETCYQAAIQLYEEYKNRDSLFVFAEAAFHYANKLNKDEYIVESLRLLSYKSVVEDNLTEADSLLNLALCHATTLSQTANIYVDLAALQSYLGYPDSCLLILEDVMTKIGKDTTGIDWVAYYDVRGICHSDAGQIANTIQDYLTVKKMTSPDSPKHKEISKELSVIYGTFDSQEKLLELHRAEQAESHAKGDHFQELFDYLNILYCLRELNDHKTSIQTGHEVIQLKNEYGVSGAFGYVYYCMGDAFRQLNQRDSAWHYIEKGIAYSRENNEHRELADNLYGKAALLIDEGNYTAAKSVAEQAISLRKYYDDELLDQYAQINAALGDYKTAHDALRKNWDEWQEHNSEEEMKRLAAMLVNDKIELERTQERQNFEHKIQSERLSNSIALLALFVVGVLVFAFFQIRSKKKLQQLNQTLQKQNEALEQFAYITSHDLKEPIRNISSFVGLLDRKRAAYGYSQEEQEYLDFIKTGAKKMYSMVEAIRQFTKVSFSKAEADVISVEEIFKTVRQHLSQLIKEKNGQLEFVNKQNIKQVVFPEQMLILILQNLAQNGFKYNDSPNPKVTIELMTKGKKVHFMVKDNGIGIRPEYFEKIFVPFKTLKNKSVNDSSGLGLTICKNILENYGGEIWLESDGTNGSRFTFAI